MRDMLGPRPDVSTPLRCTQHDRQRRPGFTLIELLVVISIIALLMAILMPTLSRVRKQARAAACQAKLRQWSLDISATIAENDGKLPEPGSPYKERFMESWTKAGSKLLLCPMASRYETNKNDPIWELRASHGSSLGSKFTAWMYSSRDPATGEYKPPIHYGSYGRTGAIWSPMPADPFENWGPQPLRRKRHTIPVVLDSVASAGDESLADPPEYDGALHKNGGIRNFCIDRHDGGINGLFLNWSVRKVGLKELWTLKWQPTWNTRGPWTKAGGVTPEDWPTWMRKFNDY